MTTISKAVYLGNNDEECCGFTVGNEYISCSYNNEYEHIEVVDDNGVCRHINNGEFHNFKLHCEDDHFVTETDCAVMPPGGDKKPKLRYYINGHEVDMIEFGNVVRTVYELDRDGVKCDTIKFEVKFE